MKKLKPALLMFVLPTIIGLVINWLTPYNVFGALWAGLKWFFLLFLVEFTLPIWAIILLILGPLLIARFTTIALSGNTGGGYQPTLQTDFLELTGTGGTVMTTN